MEPTWPWAMWLLGLQVCTNAPASASPGGQESDRGSLLEVMGPIAHGENMKIHRSECRSRASHPPAREHFFVHLGLYYLQGSGVHLLTNPFFLQARLTRLFGPTPPRCHHFDVFGLGPASPWFHALSSTGRGWGGLFPLSNYLASLLGPRCKDLPLTPSWPMGRLRWRSCRLCAAPALVPACSRDHLERVTKPNS